MEDEVGGTFGGQRGPLCAQNSLWECEVAVVKTT